jgi:predicted metal-dependent peptidase
MNRFSDDARKYIYLHECAHIVLGDVFSRPVDDKEIKQRELAADCHAAQQFRQLGIDLDKVTREIKPLKADENHPSGKTRANQIVQCFGSGSSSTEQPTSRQKGRQ